MAEGNATIAALRAASSAAPTGPSGPVALAYPWMTRQGSELVMPSRAPGARQSRPALPTAPTVLPANGFRKSTVPPQLRVGVSPGASAPAPRASGGGRVTQDTPGFVDGVTLPAGVNPNWNFNPDLMDQLMPRNADAPVYAMPPQDVVAADPKADAVASPAVNADLGLLEYIQPVPYAEAAPEPSAPAAAAAQPPVSDFDLSQLLQFAQPPGEAPASAPVAAQQQAADVTLDPELLGMLGIPRRVRGGVMR